MKSLSIQVNKDEYNKDKKFSPKITSPALELTSIQDGNIGFHLQVPRGGTHLNGVGSELTFFFYIYFALFVTVGFRLQSIAIHCNRRECGQNTHSAFFSHICTLSSLCTHHIVAQGVARRVCIKHVHPHVITCLSVCCVLVLSSSSVSRASTFSPASTCSLF